jgi:hypothetical protein
MCSDGNTPRLIGSSIADEMRENIVVACWANERPRRSAPLAKWRP